MSQHNYKPSRQPSPAVLNWVEDMFDPDMLTHLCTTDDFTDYATRFTLPGRDRFYWYQNNGADVLAVAHLDNVQADPTCQVINTAAGPLVVSGALDDRLGVYVILELLPRLGVTCDWLLTTDEEIGRSTATEFAEDFLDGPIPSKQYNWLVEFDRGGTDVVMYQYETGEYKALVEEVGARVGQGSYSDIADLDALGCAAYNWGVGYQDYHSPRAHAWLNDTFRMVARFLRFHELNAGTYMPHEPWEEDDSWVHYRFDETLDVEISEAPRKGPDEDTTIEADCGHMIDLNDERTYRPYGTNYIVCVSCDPAA